MRSLEQLVHLLKVPSAAGEVEGWQFELDRTYPGITHFRQGYANESQLWKRMVASNASLAYPMGGQPIELSSN